MTRRLRIGLLLAALTLVASACGGGDDGDAGQGDGLSVTIESPADGEEIAAPFTVELAASVPLGPTESGDHHIHVYFDGNEDDYAVVEGESYEISGLDRGEHTITASLRNADHSEAGAEDEISVTVTSGSSGDTGGRYDYGDEDPDY